MWPGANRQAANYSTVTLISCKTKQNMPVMLDVWPRRAALPDTLWWTGEDLTPHYPTNNPCWNKQIGNRGIKSSNI